MRMGLPSRRSFNSRRASRRSRRICLSISSLMRFCSLASSDRQHSTGILTAPENYLAAIVVSWILVSRSLTWKVSNVETRLASKLKSSTTHTRMGSPCISVTCQDLKFFSGRSHTTWRVLHDQQQEKKACEIIGLRGGNGPRLYPPPQRQTGTSLHSRKKRRENGVSDWIID